MIGSHAYRPQTLGDALHTPAKQRRYHANVARLERALALLKRVDREMILDPNRCELFVAVRLLQKVATSERAGVDHEYPRGARGSA